MTEEGWYEILRGAVRASENNEKERKKEILWIYTPDFLKNGTMNDIRSIPNRKGEKGNYWNETSACAGFVVSPSCPWRFEEMKLISFTPKECFLNEDKWEEKEDKIENMTTIEKNNA